MKMAVFKDRYVNQPTFYVDPFYVYRKLLGNFLK